MSTTSALSLELTSEFASQDTPKLRSSRILVVDDEQTTVDVVRHLLRTDGFTRVSATTDGYEAACLVRDSDPDLVLLDLNMPGVSGLDILDEIRSDQDVSFIPVIILTAETDRDIRRDALARGATDFINKPVDANEVLPRVRNILNVKQYQDALRQQNHNLEVAVRRRTAELEASRLDVVRCLARAAEFRDDDTGNHVLRVGRYARIIGEALGFDEDRAMLLEYAAQLHDVGKIGIPDAILLKPGKLSDEEFAAMQRHCGYGKQILQRFSSDEESIWKRHTELGSAILDAGAAPVLELATTVALTHHEWFDGTGYPLGLSGEDIPLEGRITAVADVFDALSTKRCYKEAYPLERCFEIMHSERGTHFDPTVLDAFARARQETIRVQLRYAD